MYKVILSLIALLNIAAGALAQDANIPTPQWRPAYHFSPPANWTNDPNGLLFLNGEFNLYYQHNPFENKWGHMSWGHATSTDLINWKNLPVAIPEIVTADTTTFIYSGSAVVDKDNTSGFGLNGKPPIVAIFTADQPKQHKESQYIAYSNDNGLSYRQYAHNPVIDLGKHDFRDPNVFWSDQAHKWIMTVSLVDEHKIRIYGSPDLKDWTKLSDFGPEGYTRNGWECPSLIPLVVDGNAASIKWVLFVSSGGAHGPLMQYFVGDFDGTTFKNANPDDKVLTVDYGDAFYAAIAWRDAPGNKKILLGWLQNGRKETFPWKGQMSIPHDLSISTTADGLRLVQRPTALISGSLKKLSGGRVLVRENGSLDGEVPLSTAGRFNTNSVWIDATIKLKTAGKAGFVLARKKGTNQQVVVGYDTDAGELYIDCAGSESANKDAGNLVLKAPMEAVNGTIRIQILLDKSSLEVFGNDGERVISTMIYPAENATGIAAFSEGKALFKTLKIWDLDKAK